MSEKLSLIIEATDNASSVLGNIGNTLGNLGRVAGGLALGGIAALGAGVVKFASDGLSLNNSMEKVTAQLNAFTKDGAKTADIIDTVRERAAKTPFEFDAMAKAAVALFPASKTAAGGLNAILEKAEILAASNPAEGLEGAAFALKEAVSGDFTSIIERFNLPRQFINDLKKEGVPNLEIVQRAMKEMGLDVDLVSNLANTAEGRWSTFKDTIAGVAATATKPIFEAMSTGLAGVNGLLESNAPLLNQVGATIAGVLTQGIAGLSAALPVVIASFQQFGATVGPLVMAAGASFNLIGMQIAMAMISIQPALDGILQSVSSIFGSLIPIALAAGMGAWTMISTTIQTVINSAISIIQTWLPVVQTVLAGIAAFLATHGAEIQLLVSTAWNAITTIIQTAITTVTTIINALAPIVNEIFGAISTFLNAHGSEILGFLTGAWNSISSIVSGVSAIIKKVVTDVFGAVASFIKNHGDEIQTVLTGAWNLIKTIVGGALEIIKGLVSAALAIVNGDWNTAWKSLESVTKASNDIIKSLINTAMGLIEGVIKLAVDNFKLGWENGWQLMRTATDTAMTLIKDAINTGIEAAKKVISDGVEAFIAKFNNLKDKMSVIGQQLLEGMVQGIRDKVGWLVTEGQRAAQAVLDAIKNTLGVNSPAKEAVPYGESIPEGMALGINGESGLSENAGADMADRIIERVRVALAPLSQTVAPIMAQTASTMVNAWSGLSDDLEDQILGAAESIVELAESGSSASLVFAQFFEVLRQTITGIVPSFDDAKSAMTRMHEAIAVAINTLTGEVVNSSNTMQSAIGALENRASASANAIAASMIAAGEVINTTQAQLANFVQSGGIGGITGGTYTPSQAFQDSFRNPPAVAAPRPSSVPKPTITNNTPINITITGGNVDRYAVEDGTTAALRRAGLLGRFG